MYVAIYWLEARYSEIKSPLLQRPVAMKNTHFELNIFMYFDVQTQRYHLQIACFLVCSLAKNVKALRRD